MWQTISKKRAKRGRKKKRNQTNDASRCRKEGLKPFYS
jgi:hypothetical protein